MPWVDDCRVLSGIVRVLTGGGRWSDCPEHVYDPKKTLYNRFRRWDEDSGSGTSHELDAATDAVQ